VVQQLVGDAHADDGAGHGVSAGGGQAKIPGAEVPEDGGDEKGEHHREPGSGADLEDELDGQEGNDGEGHRAGRGEHAHKVAEARPDDSDVGVERVGIDDRGDGIGGVVEAVHELERQGNGQRGSEQDIRPDAPQGDVAQVARNVEADVGQAADEGDEDDGRAEPAGHFLFLVEEGVTLGECLY
jgi:hypothetical protein